MEAQKRLLKSQNINVMLPINSNKGKDEELSPTTKMHYQKDLVT